jgi:hypothetical protein
MAVKSQQHKQLSLYLCLSDKLAHPLQLYQKHKDIFTMQEEGM